MTSMKRKATDDGSDFDSSSEASTPASSKRRNTSGVEKVAKKAARMERNRQAAQVSRDRKKQYVHELEAKIAELEAQSASTPSPVDTSRVATLEAENASLRAQLASDTIERQALQGRLSALEAQMQAITSLLSSQASTSSSTSSTPSLAAYSYDAVSPLVLSDSLAPLDPHPLVAREHSLQRNWGSMRASPRRSIPSRRPLAHPSPSTTRSSGNNLIGPKSSWTPLHSSLPPMSTLATHQPRLRISISRHFGKDPKTRFSLAALRRNSQKR